MNNTNTASEGWGKKRAASDPMKSWLARFRDLESASKISTRRNCSFSNSYSTFRSGKPKLKETEKIVNSENRRRQRYENGKPTLNRVCQFGLGSFFNISVLPTSVQASCLPVLRYNTAIGSEAERRSWLGRSLALKIGRAHV